VDGARAVSAQRMRAWQLPAGCTSADQLELLEMPKPVPAAGEVLIRVRANSLNYRDQMIPKGRYFGGPIHRHRKSRLSAVNPRVACETCKAGRCTPGSR